MIHWYAFQSKTQKEELLCEQLRIRQIETFYPCIRVRPVKAGARKVKPYFPGYVFGRVDWETSSRSDLDWIPGAVRIVDVGGEPASVPDDFIHALRQHLARINASAGPSPEFQPGDIVTIHGGPLAGYEAIFNTSLPGRDRVEVLLRMLQGTHIRVELSIDQIKLPKAV